MREVGNVTAPWCDTHGWGYLGPYPCTAVCWSGLWVPFQGVLGLDEQQNAAEKAKIMREKGKKRHEYPYDSGTPGSVYWGQIPQCV